MQTLSRLALAILAISSPACAGLTPVINGDFEAQRAQYDAGVSYLANVESWCESDITPGSMETYIECLGSRNSPREGDNPAQWPTGNLTMWVGMSVAAGGYLYQQIGTYERGMDPITVDFDAIRRASPYSTTWRTIEVQLWTGGSGIPADLNSLTTLGATKRDVRRFAAADLDSFVTYTPALWHVTLDLDPTGATGGDRLWLQFTTVGMADKSEAYLDNIAASGGATPPPPTGPIIIVR